MIKYKETEVAIVCDTGDFSYIKLSDPHLPMNINYDQYKSITTKQLYELIEATIAIEVNKVLTKYKDN